MEEPLMAQTINEGPDKHHFNAASGWIELGCAEEAEEELKALSPELREHPDVLLLRWEISSFRKQWEVGVEIGKTLAQTSPERVEGWLKQAFALHELKRTQEAWDALYPVLEHFQEVPIVPYNLACYAAQLGDLESARRLLKRAMSIAARGVIKAMAIEDPDLKPLWPEIKAMR
ncbi:MAG: tetratricopeptide repeat protein [Verrucomicrobiota bacterium]|nr:tetratricopeptide repeat protein [Verrucomicrobiota bacterium]